MKCHQCPNPAMYFVGDEETIPLCLNCLSKLSQIRQAQVEEHERMINFLTDQMEFVVGLPGISPRFPTRPKVVQVSDVKLNNINVSNSVVGTINTGAIGTLDQTISALIQLGQPELADAIKTLTEAVIASGDLNRQEKNELVEILGIVANEAASPKGSRRNVVARSLLERGAQIAGLANDLTDVCQKNWPVLLAAFAAVSG